MTESLKPEQIDSLQLNALLNKFLTAEQAAVRLQVTKGRIHQLLGTYTNGRLSAIRIGKTIWLIHVSQIEGYERELRAKKRRAARTRSKANQRTVPVRLRQPVL